MSSWLSGWGYRKSHEIIGSTAGAQTDYQIRIKAHYGSGTDSGEDVYLNGKSRTDFEDIRFTSDDGVTELSYWMEEKVDGDYAIFWVEVDSIPASPDSKTIYVYYGNSLATSISNGDATFLFFDDFEDGVIDSSKWTIYNGTWVEENGVLKQVNTSGATGWHIYSIVNIGYDLALHAKIYRNTGTDYQFGLMLRASGDKQNLYLGAYDIDLDRLWIGAVKDGAWLGRLSETDFDVQVGVWYKSVFRAYGAKVEFIDEESGTTVTYTSAENLAQKIGLHSRGGEDWFDNVFVRKYVEPEPTHGAWGSEETPAVAYEITLTESLGLSDVYARVYSGHRSFVETLSLTDVVQSAIVALKQLTETISLSDYIAKNVSVVKTETFSLSDVYTRVFNAYRTLSETLTLTDTVQALKVILVTLTETISISDYIIKNMKITKAETISLVDAYSRVLTALRELTEQIAVSDVLITSKTLVRELTESISLVDRTLKSIGKELSESVSLSDRIAAFKPLVRTLVETLNLIDSLIRFRLRKAVRLRAAVRELPAVREKEAES